MSYSTDDPNANRDQVDLTRGFSDPTNETFTKETLADVLTEELADVLNVYFTPCLIFLGIIGNLLSIIVFFRSKLRSQSTSQYLSALAVSDTVFLLQLMPPWLNAVQASRVFAQEGFCQAFVYFTYVSSSVSAWLVVAFTLERFIAVMYPLQRTRMCTVRRARLVIAAITFCCLAINVPVLNYAVPRDTDCNIDYEMMEQAARFNVADTIISFTLPLTIITILNICIVVGVCRVSRARSRLQEPRRIRRPTASAVRPRSSLHRSQQRITRMLLIVSSVFVVLNLPAYVMRILVYANNMSYHKISSSWVAMQEICLLCFYANFGINFLLYCMTGQNFRRALFQTFTCLIRIRTLMKSIGCWWFLEPGPPPRPSVTNSVSVNTMEASSSHAAGPSGVSLNHNIDGAKASSVVCDLDPSDEYLKLYRFDNTRHSRARVLHELRLHPVRGSPFPPRGLQRPEPQRPDGTFPTTSKKTEDYTMQPIPFLPIPGEIAPLGAGSMPPTPSLDPSPSPLPTPPNISYTAATETETPTAASTAITITTASNYVSANATALQISIDLVDQYYPGLFDYEAAQRTHRNECQMRFPLTPRRFLLPVRESYTPERSSVHCATPAGSGLLRPVRGPVPTARHLLRSLPTVARPSTSQAATRPASI